MNIHASIQEGIILVYFLVAINFLFNKMKDFSCHVQGIVNDNLFVKHGLNVLGVFFLLVLFTRSTPMPPAFLVGSTFVMYGFFMVITKCYYTYLAGFLVCMAVVFYLEAQKNYEASKDPARADEIKKKYEGPQLVFHGISLILVIVGFLVYLGQHSREYKKDWNWGKFWLGVAKCAGNGDPGSPKPLLKDLSDGVNRLFKT